MFKIFDISRLIDKDEPVYPGNPKPVLTRVRNFKKDGSNLSALVLGLHAASHLDAPFHYLNNGRTIDKLLLEKCVGWCRVTDFIKTKSAITGGDIARIRPKIGEIILFKTKNSYGNARRFNPKFIHIDESAAKALVKWGVRAVGTDGPSIRKFRLKPDTVHPLLLKSNILIYEGLNFKDVKAGRYFFVGLPLKIKSAEASPVRAVLIES